MGFNKVYRTLQEIFPLIDTRALRAVAIEHSKDADAAVEAVLAEVVPFFTIRSRPNTSSSGSISVGGSSGGAISTNQTADCTSVNAATGSADGQNNQQSFGDTNDVHSSLYDTDDKNPESSIQLTSVNNPSHTLGSLQGKDADSSCLDIEFDSALNNDSGQGKTSGDGNTCGIRLASFTSGDPTASLSENNLPLLLVNDNSGSDLQELDVSLPDNASSKMESTSNIANTDDESTLHGSMSHSIQIHMIDALATIIADARNNKKMLFSAMDSVISLMREVEFEEKAAEEAKVETDRGDTDILVKSVKLKQLVKQAEEDNSTVVLLFLMLSHYCKMVCCILSCQKKLTCCGLQYVFFSQRAGKVYGERAILATELRELQLRALSLSAERDKYLAVLVEMQQTLEVRLAEAQNVIKYAEQEKLEKENAAMEALTEQELIMEKVLQESKILNQQAEENAKLQEFLVDRGHVADTLQAEISVICQDMRLLKEKFDEHIPFSKTRSSSHTSFILASSGSSSKSLIPEQVEPLPDDGADESLDSQVKEGVNSSPTDHSPQVEAARNDLNSLSDDDWEIFDYDISS